MKRLVFAGAAVAAMCAQAVPTVSGVAVDGASGGSVTIRYVLSDEPAIVTLDVKTNGVSIGAEHLRNVSGDANVVVQPGDRVLKWRAYRDLPEMRLEGVSYELKAWATYAPPDYMVVDLDGNEPAHYYASEAALPGGIGDVRYRDTKLLMRYIPAANVRWRMGNPFTERVRFIKNGIQGWGPHFVTLTEDYWIGVFECTRGQYQRVMGDDPSNAAYVGDKACVPANNMPYNDLRGTTYLWPENGRKVTDESFFGKLRGKTGLDFDLPTDAQWEFACRAGCGDQIYTNEHMTNDKVACSSLTRIAWVGHATQGNSPDATVHPVGLLEPNAFGLYDMIGNVWELCVDRVDSDDYYLPPQEVVDPVGGVFGTHSVRKGGSVSAGETLGYCRCGSRHSTGRTKSSWQNGFRIWCPAEQ